MLASTLLQSYLHEHMRQGSYILDVPRKGLFCFLAQLIASILPSVPLVPKPPGTNTPLLEEKKG